MSARVIGSATIATVKDGTTVLESRARTKTGSIQTTGSISRSIAGLSADALVVVDAPQPLAATVRPFVVRATQDHRGHRTTRMGVGVAGSVLASLARAGIPGSRIVLATVDISRHRGAHTRSDVEQSLGLPVSVELPHERDRRYEGFFDGFVTMLTRRRQRDRRSATTPSEKPVFERRAERGRPFG